MSEMMNMIDLTPLFEALIGLLAAIVTIYLIPWIKTRLTSDQIAKARMVVEIAVYAAEKAYGPCCGKEKLEYAKQILAAHGVKLDTKRMLAMIDATIKKMEQNELYVLEAAETATEEG